MSDQCRLACGINHHIGLNIELGAITGMDSRACGTGAVHVNIAGLAPFQNGDAMTGCIVNEHGIEFTAHYLPCLGAFMRVVFEEIEWLRLFAGFGHKLNRKFGGVAASFHAFEYAKSA